MGILPSIIKYIRVGGVGVVCFILPEAHTHTLIQKIKGGFLSLNELFQLKGT